jgi:Ca2+-binding EF-hand superfamily protein
MLGPVVQRKTAALFKLFDFDHDGHWEREDFELFVARMAETRGLAPDAPEIQPLAEAYRQVWEGLAAGDADGDGKVTLEEALAFQEANLSAEMAAGFGQVVFPVLDADGDGEIGPDEYRQYMAVAAEEPTWADEVFAKLDRNGDGRITKDEWEQLFVEFFTSDDADAPGSSLWGPF